MLSSREHYLRDFHNRRTGETPRFMAQLAVEDGARTYPSTYDYLAAQVPFDAGPVRVLDLACGDGYLLQQLAARRQPGLELVGIDLAEGELAQARQRLGAGVQLGCGRAQALPLAEQSVDVVLCHMALMLLEDADAAVEEVMRVLRPGGTFLALVSESGARSEAMQTALPLLAAELGADAVARLPFGDPRTRRAADLATMAPGHLASSRVHTLRCARRTSVDGFLDDLLGSYTLDVLDASRRTTVLAAMRAALTAITDARGELDAGYTWNVLHATRLPLRASPRP